MPKLERIIVRKVKQSFCEFFLEESRSQYDAFITKKISSTNLSSPVSASSPGWSFQHEIQVVVERHLIGKKQGKNLAIWQFGVASFGK